MFRKVLVGALVLAMAGVAAWWLLRPGLKPKAPPRSTLDSTLTCPPSTLTIPLIFKIKDLQRTVNERFKKRILQGWVPLNKNKRDSVYLEITKTDSVRFTWKEGELRTSVPIYVSCRVMKKVGNIRLMNQKPIEAGVKIFLQTKIAIDERWRISPASRLDKVTWQKEPVLQISFISIPLKGLVNRYLEKHKGKLTHKLDSALRVALDTRPVIEKLWMDIQKPILIKKDNPRMGLKVEAKDLSFQWMPSSSGDIKGLALLKGQVYGWVDTPPATTIRNLPAYKALKNNEQHLSLYILTRIPYTVINSYVNKNLDKMKLSYSNYQVTVNKCELYASGKNLAVEMKLKGDVTGKLYLMAEPYYDSLTRQAGLKGLRYDIDTEQTLLQSADWILHDQVIAQFTDRLKTDVGKELSLLPTLIEKGIERGKAGEKIDVLINDLSVTTYAKLVTAKDIQWVLKAQGHASIALDRKIIGNKKRKKHR